ncbi:MAG TPA: penicillin acylase family protein [Opitutaceae bacterium]|nr:penicillin acylase family protein [Opitutaceae bacterium]
MFPRWLRLLATIVAFCAVLAALFVLVPLFRSLPDRSGRITMPRLAGASALQRDNHGVLRVSANNRRDAAKLLGFAHAQDRFFQMDLLRRSASGELAELLGPAALPLDRVHRRFRLREVARAALEKLPEPQREIVEDYALGVGAGLFELESAPFEYLLLRTKPAAWKPEDSFLVVASVALLLQHPDGTPELSRQVVRDLFDPATAEFLLSAADDFDAALDDSRVPAPALPAALGVTTAQFSPASLDLAPAPEAPTTDIGTRLYAAWSRGFRRAAEVTPGSNAFAIRGLRGQTPVALLANDLHLPLAVPNIWYRAEIAWRTDPTHVRTLDGVTLPGLPFLVAGTNSGMAWGFTDARADTTDLVVLETDSANPRRYRTPEGWRDMETVTESIAIRDAAPETYTYDNTIWGPVIGTDHRGRRLALRWVMADAAAYDFEFANFETLNSARAALAFAKKAGMPSLNFLAVDRDGNLGWTVAGRLPRRVGFDGASPVSWADGTARWDGWLTLDQHPQIYNPTSGKLWSANNRMLAPESLTALGDAHFALGARASRLRERLVDLKEFSPEALLDIQLDVRGVYLERWQQLLLAALDPTATAAAPARAKLRSLAENWGGQAVPESAGYRVVHDFRAAVLREIDALVFARCRAALPTFDSCSLPLDRIAFTLASQQPAGWHPEGAAGWQKLLLAAADSIVTAAGGADRLDQFTWGEANRLAMRHQLSGAFPLLGRFLDLPADRLPGDALTVRTQTPDFGATVRFVIQPGWEEGSLLHMPGGQCANPLSPYYSDDHAAWLKGAPAPLQPGKAEDHMVLVPPKD